MADKWIEIDTQVTGTTQWTTAGWANSTGSGEGQLTVTQLSPVSSGAPTPRATTAAFDTSGYGGGVTISYLIRSGTKVQIAFDTNNDVTGLSLVKARLLNSITTQPQVQNAPASGPVAFSTSGLGLLGAITLTATTPGGPIIGIIVTAQGSGYNVGDTLTFSNAALQVVFGPLTVGSLVVTLQEKDRDIANSSWVETIPPPFPPPDASANRLFVSSQDAHAAVRLRLAVADPGPPRPDVRQIRLMCAT
jgi:hypothetical protein